VTVKQGDSVTWVNNKGFPHFIEFDEDEGGYPVSAAHSWRHSSTACIRQQRLLRGCLVLLPVPFLALRGLTLRRAQE
jgi:hypothetical protein